MRTRFPLSSEQLELLLALEHCGGLAKLAAFMAKDASVISRHLQRLAEAAPVVIKKSGRWQISPLGLEVNRQASAFHGELVRLLKLTDDGDHQSQQPLLKKSALLVINAQRGLLDRLHGRRSNAQAEANIAAAMAAYRSLGWPLIHVRHVTENRASPFWIGSTGVAFIPELAPDAEEIIIDKHKANGFADTTLLEQLNAMGIETVVITGFTANECIDATARQASDFGFSTFVVGDATASFDVFGPDGTLHPAERVHQLTLANLHANFAAVIGTSELLQKLQD